METKSLEEEVEGELLQKTPNERAYLSSIMPEARQEGYTCVTGCSNCVSCGSSDYDSRK